MMKLFRITLIVIVLSGLGSCKKYLDIVPDNVATIDYAFRMRAPAEKYLFTCYSFLPQLGNLYESPGLDSGDELWWVRPEITYAPWMIARGNQNVNAPYLDYWNGIKPLWRGIRECNIFLENIQKVKDLQDFEKSQWEAEVKFLKAYYHFFLMRMYGPIPIMKENIPVSASAEEVRVSRRPVDEVVDYIVQLLDEAAVNLPDNVADETAELGRITKPIALGMKAKILTYAASPLFNGNSDYATYTNKDGTKLFSATYNAEKWKRAADACKEAIDLCHSLQMKLYYFSPTPLTKNLSPELLNEMNIRNSFTERWNSEIIWAHTNSNARSLQVVSSPKILPPAAVGNFGVDASLGVPFKIASLFYSENGVPIDEDLSWNYNNRYKLRVGTDDEKYQIKEGYTTAEFNFDRESRFYASLGFDGGTWYGQGNYDGNNLLWLETRLGQVGGKRGNLNHAVTGYFPKKYIYYTNILSTTSNTYSSTDYPWVMLRLSDLYLLYAEALNEYQGPDSEVYNYLDLIRKRAGLPGVVESWRDHSRNPNKPSTKEGLREIIHRERAIELALEGQRFWDLRRWKEASTVYNAPITGWDMDQASPEAYYRERFIFEQKFSLKDYFWPIRQYDLIVNKNLVQSPGW
ncbi:MAG TPA: RagB/SusD family nutrient uptake outer membrane protein [Sphingobacteriaceae bacterium]